MAGLSNVSISVTSAVVYFVSGTIFFSLIFLLVMLGVTDCNWDCSRLFSVNYFRFMLLRNIKQLREYLIVAGWSQDYTRKQLATR